MKETYIVTSENFVPRLDRWLANHFQVSVASVRRLLSQGEIRINGRVASKGILLRVGDEIVCQKAPVRKESYQVVPAPEQELTVLYQDSYLLALEKSSGIPTHPLEPGEQNTLANALVARFPECQEISSDRREAGIAHRLDRETSGILLAARTKETFVALRNAFSRHQIQKSYLAIVEGTLTLAQSISFPIAHAKDRRRTIALYSSLEEKKYSKAQEASTHVTPVAHQEQLTLVEAKTSYGRMHQVRVHLAAIGFPLLGDVLYGATQKTMSTCPFFLHASYIKFLHPHTNEFLEIFSPKPTKFQKYFPSNSI